MKREQMRCVINAPETTVDEYKSCAILVDNMDLHRRSRVP